MYKIKIYGNPNILLGFYTSISEEGIINIYEETPKSFAKMVKKILKNNSYRHKLEKKS